MIIKSDPVQAAQSTRPPAGAGVAAAPGKSPDVVSRRAASSPVSGPAVTVGGSRDRSPVRRAVRAVGPAALIVLLLLVGWQVAVMVTDVRPQILP